MYIDYYIKKIGKKKKVLDLGSGNNPCFRADVCVDYYLEDDTQRDGSRIFVPKNKKFIKWNLNEYPYPFKNQEFDFVICGHIAEHINNPQKFCKEIQRIGKAGYIESPNKLYEQLYGWDFHKWYVYTNDGKLIFENINIDEKLQIGRRLYKICKPFHDYINHNVYKLLTIFPWKGKFEYKVIRKKRKYLPSEIKQTEIKPGYPFFIKKIFSILKK